jgi:hypothetical protein
MPSSSSPGGDSLGSSSIVTPLKLAHRVNEPGSEPMRLIFDIAQGIGLSSATGIRPFLPALLACALARGDLGLNFEGTDFAFMESTWFLIVLFVGVVATVMVQRQFGPSGADTGPIGAAMSGIGIGLGALLFAGTMADHGYTWWPGLVGGIACGALASAATRPFFNRVRARLEAGLAILIPPVAFLFPFVFVWLLIGAQRKEGRKYAGLRSLR